MKKDVIIAWIEGLPTSANTCADVSSSRKQNTSESPFFHSSRPIIESIPREIQPPLPIVNHEMRPRKRPHNEDENSAETQTSEPRSDAADSLIRHSHYGSALESNAASDSALKTQSQSSTSASKTKKKITKVDLLLLVKPAQFIPIYNFGQLPVDVRSIYHMLINVRSGLNVISQSIKVINRSYKYKAIV